MMERYKDPRETLLEKLEPGVKKDPRFGPITLHLRDRTVWVGDNYERLSDVEYKMLWILIRARGNLVSVPEIEKFVYEEREDDKDIPLSNGLMVYLTRIRNKLEALGATDVEIINVSNRGYYLELKEKDKASEA